MSLEDNKAAVRRMNEALAEWFQTGDSTRFLETVHPGGVIDIPGMPPGLDGLQGVVPAFRAAFPDLQMTIGEMTAEHNRVAYRVSWTATQAGELMGIPASGKKITVTETHVDHIKDGKIIRHEGDWDQFGMLQQVGAVPTPEPAA